MGGLGNGLCGLSRQDRGTLEAQEFAGAGAGLHDAVAIGLIAPARSAGLLRRIRGIVVGAVLVIAIIALGSGIVELVSLPFGGLSLPPAVLLGVLLDIVALVILTQLGRRKRNAARAKASIGG